ncbi:helix-turn-helix transcriptional regulator [Amycolatopsis sp. NPDC051061]|uniref:helix-turn-helix domain-containing protein n=1 Tax=Amycolatopsis sp. NPDC051061 TaxID=3155042 RepID=UPI00341A348E
MMATPGRPENKVDPNQSLEARFGVALRQLRENHGRPTYRDMEKRPGVHFTHSVLSQAANGKKLPPWEHVKAYVVACEGPGNDRALDYWKRQYRQHGGQLDEDDGPRGRVGLQFRPLAMLVGTIGAGIAAAAAALLIPGLVSPPPATQLELAVDCAPGPTNPQGQAGILQPLPPGSLGGQKYEGGYGLHLQRNDGATNRFQKVSCSVNYKVESMRKATFSARVGVPDGVVKSPTVTVQTSGVQTAADVAGTIGGDSSPRQTFAGRSFVISEGWHHEVITFDFITQPGAGEANVVIADPRVVLSTVEVK